LRRFWQAVDDVREKVAKLAAVAAR